MSSLPDQSYCNPHAHSLRCRSCSVPLIMLPSISCCKTRVSLCDSCYTDNKCLNCITRDLSTGLFTVLLLLLLSYQQVCLRYCCCYCCLINRFVYSIVVVIVVLSTRAELIVYYSIIILSCRIHS